VTKDVAWVLGQFALAWVLVVVSAVGAFGGARGFAAILFWAILPGAALSFVINALVMRRHGEAGLASYQKATLIVQVVTLAGIVALTLSSETGGFMGVLYGTVLYLTLAAIALGMAVERNGQLHPRASDDADAADSADSAEETL